MFTSMRRSYEAILATLGKSDRKRKGRRSTARGSRLRYEQLEDRRVLTAGITTQAALIAAINAANTAGGSNTITLGANIKLFENTADNTTNGPNGLPVIASGDNLTIIGKGHTIQRSTKVGDADFRLFDIASGGTLTLSDVTLANGLVASGAGSALKGGAIFVSSGGTLHLQSTTLSNNSVANHGDGTKLTLEGGAIYNAGTTTIDNSSIKSNSAEFTITNAAGQGNNQGDSAATNDNGSDGGNGADGNVVVEGGGIYNLGTLTMTSSALSFNTATSTITNGSKKPAGKIGNGNSNGDTDSGDHNGGSNGNGLDGDLTVEGGGLYNAGTATLGSDHVTNNEADLTLTNGSYNGNNNGDGDTGDHNGDNNGNGVNGDVTVAGGGIYNFDSLTNTDTSVTSNNITSKVVNGSNNGNNNGETTEDFNGNDNGNAIVGDMLVRGAGIANDASATASLTGGKVSQNAIDSTVTNGDNNGDNNGVNNAGLGDNEGKNNGNAVVGSLSVGGAGIDNLSGGNVSLSSVTMSANTIKSTITNGSSDGNHDGNDDGDGNAVANGATIHGGGIHNAGTMTITSLTMIGNSVSNNLHNGSSDGNNVGDNDTESHDGREDGNGVSGDVLVAGGAIANGGSLTATHAVLAANFVKSVIVNGSGNGNHDGQSDGANNDDGNNCGNGVGGDVEVDGGAVGNSGTASFTNATITGNAASSSITNGTGNGRSDGGGTPASTGTDGQGDGNGVNGDVRVLGGGTADLGTMTFTSSSVSGNAIISTPRSGHGDTTLDGVTVNGTVTVSGANQF